MCMLNIYVDLTDVVQTFGFIDIWINNAGVSTTHYNSLEGTSDEEIGNVR